jgi:hypothetical protein
LKLSVIINAQLSHRAHFDRLVELASFTGARLVFFECSNQNDQDLDYYDVGNVPKLNIAYLEGSSLTRHKYYSAKLPYHSAKLNL